jgi:hypothetical protein
MHSSCRHLPIATVIVFLTDIAQQIGGEVQHPGGPGMTAVGGPAGRL